MGKIGGFLEYKRCDNECVAPLERIKNFNEFHIQGSEEERRRQGARCMNCGVPLCQTGMMLSGMMTGCPLHNLIPEWNDEVYNGNYEHAAARLLKSNNFPEFTGRVCPALCEKACICGKDDDPVTVHENELFIIEKAFENGYIKPQIPKVKTGKRVAVVGSGPSGLAVADQLGKRGHDVTVFEKNTAPGGLLMYGIPNMKLDKKIVKRRIDLMKQEGITFECNSDVGKTFASEDLLKSFDAVVLCCGAQNARGLGVKGDDMPGIYFAVDFLTMNTKHLLDENEPYISAKDKNVIIVGGGDTGNDCTGTCMRHGAKSITALEMMPKAPDVRAANNPWPEWPKICKTDYGQEEVIAVFGHDPRLYTTSVKTLIPDENGHLAFAEIASVKFENGKLSTVPGTEKTIPCELLIIAAGFVGCKSYVSDAFSLPLTGRHTLVTEGTTHATEKKGIFAAGDCRNGQSLVVRAIADGRACAREVDEYLMGYSMMP